MGIFEIKIYVNVYRFLRKYSVFYISTVRFSLFSFLLFRVLREKSAISGTFLNEDGDIALRMLSLNLFT